MLEKPNSYIAYDIAYITIRHNFVIHCNSTNKNLKSTFEIKFSGVLPKLEGKIMQCWWHSLAKCNNLTLNKIW